MTRYGMSFFFSIFLIACGPGGNIRYVIVDHTGKGETGSSVTLEGPHIGDVTSWKGLGNNRILLELTIKRQGVKIPRSCTVKYRDNLLGEKWVDISSEKDQARDTGYYADKDTLPAIYVPFPKIDTIEIRKAIDTVIKLKKEVDSVLNVH